MKMISGQMIWKMPKPYNPTSLPDPERIRLEFPHLIRFKDHWYCTFREAQMHHNHWSGQSRVIRSADGINWESVALLKWDSGDVGLSRFSITAEGNLMVNALVHFVSREPRANGEYYQLNPEDYAEKWVNMTPRSDAEKDITQQSLSWLSSDGVNWSTAHACPSGANTQRVDVAWYNGMGYSIGYGGKDVTGTLYRTRDGKSWRALKKDLFSGVGENESDVAFLKDGTACCLARCGSPRVMIGIGKAPYYQEWEWKSPDVDWHGDGNLRPAADVFRVDMGGPDFICLENGRLLGAARMMGPPPQDGKVEPDRIDPDDPEGREDGKVALFWIDPEKSVLTLFAEVHGTSYPGICEYDGKIWISYLSPDRRGICMAHIDVPH